MNSKWACLYYCIGRYSLNFYRKIEKFIRELHRLTTYVKILDVLNILLPINQTFMKLAWEKFNPRNVMYISRNDGYFNSAVSMQRDTLINANTLARCGRDTYTQEDIDTFDRLLALKESILSSTHA